MRRSCLSNISSDLYLPSEAGEVNSFVILISSKTIKPSCNFNVYSSTSEIRLLFVMEFFGQVACKENQFVVYNDDDTITDVCTKDADQGVYKHHMLVERLSLLVNIQEIDEFSLTKVVITAATIPSSIVGDCGKLGKINCSINDAICIDRNLQCDGDFNCGVKFGFDEDKIICGVVQENMWVVMLFTFLFVTYSSMLLYRCLKKSTTPVPQDFFILNENKDERILKPHMKPPQLKISRSFSKDQIKISLYDRGQEPSGGSVEKEKIISTFHEEGIPSSSITESWEESADSEDTRNFDFRKVRKKKWPVFTKGDVPSYEKRLSERMKLKMLTCTTSEDEKPKVTFYATTTKLP
ncbi:uncharacterized protein [Leptinotarsa decemlineata]|uniref:uncharacterized protein n=1 Tax=Leptinotarsa decemlineata TaxID=7539 RepID=UPI003D30CAD2